MIPQEPIARHRFQTRMRTQLAKAVREVEMFEYDDNLVFEQETLGLQRFQVARLRLDHRQSSFAHDFDE